MNRLLAVTTMCCMALSLMGCSCRRAMYYHPSGVVYSGDYTNGWADSETSHISGGDCECSKSKKHSKHKKSGCGCGGSHHAAPVHTGCSSCDGGWSEGEVIDGCSTCGGGEVISSGCASCGGASHGEVSGCATCGTGIPSGSVIQHAPTQGGTGAPPAPGAEEGASEEASGDSASHLRPQDVPNTNAQPIQQTHYLQWVPRKL